MTTTDAQFRQFLETGRQRVQRALEARLPSHNHHPRLLHEAMSYAVLGAGKRLRPLLVYASGLAVEAPDEALDAPACAVELVHAYSLVHDDLPAMDDDDLRRGRPTCHRRFNEAQAILAGDALQTLAFQVLAERAPTTVAADTTLRMLHMLAVATGSRGMAGGQSLDLDAVGRDLDMPQLEDMHIHKTGALIRASIMLGALGAPGVEQSTLDHLDRYGKCIGLAFQVCDDILDVTGDTDTLGKQAGADRARGKPTFPELMGLDGAREHARTLHAEALENLQPLGPGATTLVSLADFIVGRDH